MSVTVIALWALCAGPGDGLPPGLVQASVALPDGRQIPALVHHADLLDGHKAARFSPQLTEGAFWGFGDAFQRQLIYRCEGTIPVLNEGVLSCPTGSIASLLPDVTLPDDPTAHPNSNVPPVQPRGRPVTQSAHFLLPWLAPSAIAMLLLTLLAWWLRRRSQRYEAPAVQPTTPLNRHALLALLGLTALGLAARLINLGFEPFEQNEFTYWMSGFGHKSPVGVILDVNGMAQTHPPLFHLILLAFKPLGSDELVARLPAALAGAATVPLFFTLAWRVFEGRMAPSVVATLLLALSPVHVWYSQDVSPYSFTTLFAVLVVYSGERILHNAISRRAWWGLIVGTWGLVYTHYYGLHLSFAVFMVLLICGLRQKSPVLTLRAIAAGCATWVGIVPWIGAFVQAYLWSRGHSTAYQRLVGIYHEAHSPLADTLDTLRLLAGYRPQVALLALVPAAAAVVGALRIHRRWLILAPLLWFIPFELLNRATFLHTLYGGYYFGVRYFLFLFPLVWLLMAAGFERFGRVGWAVAALSLSLTAWDCGERLLKPDKPDVVSATALVKKSLADGDAVIVGPGVFYQHPVHYYWAEPAERPHLGINQLMQTPLWRPIPGALRGGPAFVGLLSELFEPLSRSLQSHHIQRVWVLDHTQHLFDRREFSDRPTARLNTLLATGFTQTWRREFRDTSVTLWERTQGGPEVGSGERLHLGWSDGPFVRRFAPPWAYAGPGRTLRPGAQVRLTAPATPRRSLTLRMGLVPAWGYPLDEAPVPLATTRLAVALNGRRSDTIVLTGGFMTVRIPLQEAEMTGPLTIDFHLTPPAAGSGRPPDVVLDWIDCQ